MQLQTHTHTAHTLSDTHTSFPETYLLSHTPRSLSNPPWWRLIAAFKACWAPPVKAGAPRAAPVCASERETVLRQDPSREDHDRLDLWSQPPQLDHRHRGHPSRLTGTQCESIWSRLDSCWMEERGGPRGRVMAAWISDRGVCVCALLHKSIPF